ncbi:MAG: DUF2569 domain-containing protein [Gammaproteobacteria bacterium]
MGDLSKPEPVGIGGWLILVVIGLIYSPIQIAYFLMMELWPIFTDGTWSVLTTSGTEAYHPLWAPLLVFEVIGNLGSIALALATLWFMFKRSRRTPAVAIAWLLWTAAFVIADFIGADMIPAVASQQVDPDTVKQLVRSIVSVCIWVPYFMVSKRVKATFVQ